ncbi:MAG: hypothetical protein ACREHD_08690, partial [Pirellulales bacterium]
VERRLSPERFSAGFSGTRAIFWEVADKRSPGGGAIWENAVAIRADCAVLPHNRRLMRQIAPHACCGGQKYPQQNDHLEKQPDHAGNPRPERNTHENSRKRRASARDEGTRLAGLTIFGSIPEQQSSSGANDRNHF